MKGFILAVALLLMSDHIAAQEPNMPEFRTYALLVGVSEYDYHDDLNNPVRDVKAIEKELREVYRCETKILIDPRRDDFIAELHELADTKYDREDQLLVYFVGNGWFDEKAKRGYVALRDTQPLRGARVRETSASYGDIRAILERLDCRHVLLIVDSCFSGTLDPAIAEGNKMRIRSLYNDGVRSEYDDVPRSEVIRRKLKYSTRRYITAGGKVSVLDGPPGCHSPFARGVLDALRSCGGRDGILTLEEMVITMGKATPELCIGELSGNEFGSSFILVADPTIVQRKVEVARILTRLVKGLLIWACMAFGAWQGRV